MSASRDEVLSRDYRCHVSGGFSCSRLSYFLPSILADGVQVCLRMRMLRSRMARSFLIFELQRVYVIVEEYPNFVPLVMSENKYYISSIVGK